VPGAIYGVIVAFAFMFPNAELALMFIPVPIKAKYFWFSFSRFVFRSPGQSIFGGGIAHFAHVEVLYLAF
jgi:membrane associated rhomboid family serine protease